MPADADRQAPSRDVTPALGEILEVLRPQVEKIEEGFTAIRVTLDALAAHLSGAAKTPHAVREKPPSDSVPRGAVAQPVAPVAGAAAVTAGRTADSATRIPTAQPIPVEAATPAPQPEAALPPRATPAAATARPGGSAPVADLPPAAAPTSPARADRPGMIAVSRGDGGDWSRILFGDSLRAVPSISHLSGVLLADVYAGDNGAIGMAGQLMTFRTGTAEQKARLLKDVGEAFYGWKPRGDDSLLEPLIAWVHAELDAVDLGNRIMVVQIGDRYDMQRHNSKQPGVEVAEVYGWVVLRDNGKVFSKANVAVK